MYAEIIFKYATMLAVFGWLMMLILTPLGFRTEKVVVGIVVATLSVTYTLLLVNGFSASDFMKFSTLEGVMSLLGNKTAMAAGWIHYLAFDLMTGNWIVCNARKLKIPFTYILPSLLFTFMAGPFGLLLYIATRWLTKKQYFFPEN